MKTCFGADNVNDDSDSAFKSCSANTIFGGDDATSVQKLPGCNPIQSGPALATQATGAGCSAADAASTPVASVVSNLSSALPSVSISLAQKQADYASDGGYGGATPTLEPTSTAFSSSSVSIYTPTAVSDGGTLGLVFSDDATNPPSLVKPTTLPPLSHPTGGCKVPVYITITPTVTVTVGAIANATTCDNTPSTTTLTERTTVTVPAAGYKHRRHGDLHRKN